MISDQSYEELHIFAARIGIPRRGFERDHYDVISERYALALAAGAQPVRSREIVTLLTSRRLASPTPITFGTPGRLASGRAPLLNSRAGVARTLD